MWSHLIVREGAGGVRLGLRLRPPDFCVKSAGAPEAAAAQAFDTGHVTCRSCPMTGLGTVLCCPAGVGRNMNCDIHTGVKISPVGPQCRVLKGAR